LEWSTKESSTVAQASDPPAELFAFVEHSESNTMALVRKVRAFLVCF
jgi:hypothetical protein